MYNLPRAFMDFSNTQIVLDCTEIVIEKPSSLMAQWQTWSDYKHNNTVKLLIGVTPNGTVNFVSRLWGGRTYYRCLQGILPLSESHLIEQMALISFVWTNLLPPLFKK